MKHLTALLIICLTFAIAQEDVEQYLLTDSLEIDALVNTAPEEDSGPDINLYTHYGLTTRIFGEIQDLNSELETLGYGLIPESSLGWSFGNRLDIGDHFTFGFSYLSNFLIEPYTEGPQGSSKLTYFNILFDFAYRFQLGSLSLAPETGLGFSTTLLSFKPNGLESMTWDEYHANTNLASALNQSSLTLSLGAGIHHSIPWWGGRSRLLGLRGGMVFNPLTFGGLGISTGEWSAVKVEDAPAFSNSGVYLQLYLTGATGEKE